MEVFAEFLARIESNRIKPFLWERQETNKIPQTQLRTNPNSHAGIGSQPHIINNPGNSN
jgi:hypothetical protein